MKTPKGRPKSACEVCHGKGVVTEKHVHGPYCYVETTGEDKQLVCNCSEDSQSCPGCASVKLFEEKLKKLGISTRWRHGEYESLAAHAAWLLVSDPTLTKLRAECIEMSKVVDRAGVEIEPGQTVIVHQDAGSRRAIVVEIFPESPTLNEKGHWVDIIFVGSSGAEGMPSYVLEVCPAVKDEAPRCACCGVEFEAHLGVEGTCRRHQGTRAALMELRWECASEKSQVV